MFCKFGFPLMQALLMNTFSLATTLVLILFIKPILALIKSTSLILQFSSSLDKIVGIL